MPPSRLLDRLERQGPAERRRDANDQRTIIALILATGLAQLSKLGPVIRKFNRSALGHLGERRLTSLLGLLESA